MSAARAVAVVAFAVATLGANVALADPPEPDEPLAGISAERLFVRSADNQFVVFPKAQLVVDSYFFVRHTRDVPAHTVFLRNARVGAAGWMGPWLYWDLSGELAPPRDDDATPFPQSLVATTDAYVALAHDEDLAVLQLGQFDAPFSFENRTADMYTDFMERSRAVRAVGFPGNKGVGAMWHGAVFKPFFYYSIAALNGDRDGVRSIVENGDLMARVALYPAEVTFLRLLTTMSIGASVWHGVRGSSAPIFPAQDTPGGFRFFETTWALRDGRPAALRQHGDVDAIAFEVNIPIRHHVGVRAEWLLKRQDLAELDEAGQLLGDAELHARGRYVEAWWWVLGDDGLLPRPALQLPQRLGAIRPPAERHGFMLAARWDHVHLEVEGGNPTFGNPTLGTTDIHALDAGFTYWYSRRFRATVDYGLSWFGGSSRNAATTRTRAGSEFEHEVGLRAGVSM